MYGADLETKASELIGLYPVKKQAIMPLLHLVQERDGWISLEAETWIAEKCGVTPAYVHGVSTFYTMYRTVPAGKHMLQVSTTISCMMRGCDTVLEHIQKKLGIEVGETTADGQFTLVRVECLGSCGTAPVIQVDDDYYEDMDLARTDQLLESLRQGKPIKPGPGPQRVLVE
jgi:NADH-quinone oxidoreductase E subunit